MAVFETVLFRDEECETVAEIQYVSAGIDRLCWRFQCTFSPRCRTTKRYSTLTQAVAHTEAHLANHSNEISVGPDGSLRHE
jgi:hypothetical protein